jgi:hypothetical protein
MFCLSAYWVSVDWSGIGVDMYVLADADDIELTKVFAGGVRF